jgi:hypothetical protein
MILDTGRKDRNLEPKAIGPAHRNVVAVPEDIIIIDY